MPSSHKTRFPAWSKDKSLSIADLLRHFSVAAITKLTKFPHSNPDPKTNIHHHPQGILIPKLLTQLHLLADQLEPAFFIAKMSENWVRISFKTASMAINYDIHRKRSPPTASTCTPERRPTRELRGKRGGRSLCGVGRSTVAAGAAARRWLCSTLTFRPS